MYEEEAGKEEKKNALEKRNENKGKTKKKIIEKNMDREIFNYSN